MSKGSLKQFMELSLSLEKPARLSDYYQNLTFITNRSNETKDTIE